MNPLGGRVERKFYMPDLQNAINIGDLREMARRRLPRAIFDFFDGGAED